MSSGFSFLASNMYLCICLLVSLLLLVKIDANQMMAAKRNGINFLNGQWSSPKFDSSEAMTSLQQLQNGTGSNWIALTYCSFQWSVDSSGPIYSKPSTPTPQQLKSIVAEARSRSMKVFFRPCIDPDWSNPATEGTWRGEIGRHFNATEWNTWFGYYLPYIVNQAKLAQELSVDMFSVGMEYVVPAWQEHHWRQVVAAVRQVYSSGPITYCANHGNEGLVAWWDAVDEISIDAYYDLLPSNSAPSVEQLTASWGPIIAGLGLLSGVNGHKPVNFGEIGYCSVTGANTDPANCGVSRTKQLNLTAQANLYQAFFDAVYGQEWFHGVFWWGWLTMLADGGPANLDFTPHGKPAAEILLKYFLK